MDAVRESWTDERLDAFSAHVDRRFDAVDRRFDAIERRVDKGFDRVDREIGSLRTEMNSRFERVESRIDDVNRTMLRLGGGAIVTFVVGFAGMIATQI